MAPHHRHPSRPLSGKPRMRRPTQSRLGTARTECPGHPPGPVAPWLSHLVPGSQAANIPVLQQIKAGFFCSKTISSVTEFPGHRARLVFRSCFYHPAKYWVAPRLGCWRLFTGVLLTASSHWTSPPVWYVCLLLCCINMYSYYACICAWVCQQTKNLCLVLSRTDNKIRFDLNQSKAVKM